MMADCVALTRRYVEANGTNKQGWPTTGFYKAVADKGVKGAQTDDGFNILIDHPQKPGAMRQRFYGGTIKAGSGTSWVTGAPTRYLTIPARAEAYGYRGGGPLAQGFETVRRLV